MNIIISEEHTNKRLDKFLVEFGVNESELKGFSRGDFIRAIKNDLVLVNEKKAKPSYKTSLGDKININMEKAEEKIIPNSKVKLDIIFENKDFLIINKPAGIQVHPDFNEKKRTIVNGLVSLYPEIARLEDDHVYSFQMRPGIVHRLDKETSGALIIAKNKNSFLEFKKMFQEKTVTKKYLAIVHGIPEEKEGVIDKPLARTSNYRKQTIAGKKTKTKIREAVTHYETVKKLKSNLSLLELTPQTGRTHQLRVHLLSIDHPIIGDNLYQKKHYEKFEKAKRHMLHASEISFNLWEKEYNFTAPLSKDFEDILNSLS